MKKDKQFKVGDRVIHEKHGKGVVVLIGNINGCIVDVEFDSGQRSYTHINQIKRLVKKKKTTREPRRFWINEYSDGRLFIYKNKKDYDCASKCDDLIYSTEVVEVIK